MPLNLPQKQFNIKKSDDGRLRIFDRLRRKFVALTPEEWVRQNFVAFLIDDRGFPAGLMANEVSLTQNGISRRCDTLVSDRNGRPFVIVEYKAPTVAVTQNVKAPTVAVTQNVFDQIVRYNMVFQARYLIVSNGLAHYCCSIDYTTGSYTFLEEIPHYRNL